MDILRDARVVEPANEEEVSTALGCANRDGLAVIPRGGGTKLDWGNPPARADIVLSTAKLNRVLEHAWADLTVTVEAGCTVADLQRTLAQHGQRLAIDVLWPERATIGGILATNDSGVLRLAYGALRDLVIGATLVLADGTIARSGGKVVKNVAGYDLPKLVTGAMGTLGVITQATFRLHPLPRKTRSLTIAAGDREKAQRLLMAIEAATLAHVALQWRMAAGAEPLLDIQFEGTAAGIEAQEVKLRELAQPAVVAEGSPDVWLVRERVAESKSVAKLSVLPSRIAETLEAIAKISGGDWRAVFQATGIGWLAIEAPLEQLRTYVENEGGSVTILRGSRDDASIGAWGDTGAALALMRAVKQQFDPNGTLNPGRFVGGI